MRVPATHDAIFDGILYRGWDVKVPGRGGCWWFLAWTPTRVILPGRRRSVFATVAWRRGFVRSRVAGSAFAWKARDRAYRWYCEKAGRRFQSLHKPEPLSRAERARRAARLRRS